MKDFTFHFWFPSSLERNWDT